MPARMKLTAWGHDAMKALTLNCGLIGFVITAVLFILIEEVLSLFTGQPHENLFNIAGEILWGLFFLAFMATWLKERTSGGRILFDCGLHLTWYKCIFLLLAVSFIFFAVKDFFAATSVSKAFGNEGYVLSILFAICFIILATCRGQVKEKGIWLYCRLLRWDKIRSYRWKDDSNLLFLEKGFLSFEVKLHVSPEHRQAVDDLLRTHASVQPTA